MKVGHYLGNGKEPVRNLKENDMMIFTFMKDPSDNMKTHGFEANKIGNSECGRRRLVVPIIQE